MSESPGLDTLAITDMPIGDGDASPDRRTLLFLHANGMNAQTWAPLIDALSSLGAHGTARLVDLPGHGRAPQPLTTDGLWVSTARAVQAVLEASPDVVLVGHSLGASLALVAAAGQTGVAGIFAFEPVVVTPGLEADARTVGGALAGLALRRRSSFESADVARERLFSKPPLSSFAPAVIDAWLATAITQHHDHVELTCSPELEAQFFAQTAVQDVFAVLPGVHVPVAIAVGSDSYDAYPGVAAKQVVDALPHATLHVVNDVGHFGPLESPVAVAAHLATWLHGLATNAGPSQSPA